MGGHRAEEGVPDGLGLGGPVGHHQDLPGLHDVPDAHGAGVGGDLLQAGEEAAVGLPGAVGELHLVGAQGEGVGGLVEADVAVDPQAQQLQVDAAQVPDDLVIAGAGAVAVGIHAVGDVGVGQIQVDMVEQVVPHEIGVALVVVPVQAHILVQVDGADLGEVQLARLTAADQLLIGPHGAGAGGQAQDAAGLEDDLGGDDIGGGAAERRVVLH